RQAEAAGAAKRGGGGRSDAADAAQRHRTTRVSLAGIEDRRVMDTLLVECRERIASLPETLLQRIASDRLDGYTVEEIAARHDVAVSTIERKLSRIRANWKND
ncbi:MAG: hypothetical protein KDA89_20890, partial [Planctomycetaceae bacterium]|nr:hypothetical protein [Planctomycetaceae bacterium]